MPSGVEVQQLIIASQSRTWSTEPCPFLRMRRSMKTACRAKFPSHDRRDTAFFLRQVAQHTSLCHRIADTSCPPLSAVFHAPHIARRVSRLCHGIGRTENSEAPSPRLRYPCSIPGDTTATTSVASKCRAARLFFGVHPAAGSRRTESVRRDRTSAAAVLPCAPVSTA